MTKKKYDWRVICTGLICITGLEMAAMYNGFNGRMLSLVLMVIAGAIGVTLPQVKLK